MLGPPRRFSGVHGFCPCRGSSFQLPTTADLGEQQLMTSLPPASAIWVEFPAPCFSPLVIPGLWGVTQKVTTFAPARAFSPHISHSYLLTLRKKSPVPGPFFLNSGRYISLALAGPARPQGLCPEGCVGTGAGRVSLPRLERRALSLCGQTAQPMAAGDLCPPVWVQANPHPLSPTLSSLVAATPSPARRSLGCSSSTVRKSFSEVWVKKPISALGWRP